MKLRNGLTTTSEINWSSLPSHIVAKIVHFTSCAERQRKQKVTNQRFTTIRHFASVCNRWKAAILASRELFVNIDFPENVNFKYDNSISGLTIHFLDRSSRKMVDHEKTKLVVKKGYLQVAECVVLHHHHDPNIVYLLCEFANRNSIKRFHVETWSDWETEHLNAFLDLLARSKPKSINIRYWINGNSQADVDKFWSFFIGVLNSCKNDVHHLHFELENVQVMNVVWSLISKYITLNKSGSVKKLVLDFGAFSRQQFQSYRFEYQNLKLAEMDEFVCQLKGMENVW